MKEKSATRHRHVTKLTSDGNKRSFLSTQNILKQGRNDSQSNGEEQHQTDGNNAPISLIRMWVSPQTNSSIHSTLNV